MTKSWGTDLLADPTMFGFLVLVKLPDGMFPTDKPNTSTAVDKKPFFDVSSAEKLQDTLHYDFRIEVYCTYIMRGLFVHA